MDLDDVENLDLNALGGTDTITVNNLAGTDLSEVNVALAGTIGGGTGDSVADNVIVNATNNIDNVVVVGAGSSVAVTGLSAVVNITTTEGANDRLTVNSLDGNDNVDANTLPAGVIGLTLSGGIGEDVSVRQRWRRSTEW